MASKINPQLLMQADLIFQNIADEAKSLQLSAKENKMRLKQAQDIRRSQPNPTIMYIPIQDYRAMGIRELYIILAQQYIMLGACTPGSLEATQRASSTTTLFNLIKQREAKQEPFISPFTQKHEAYFKLHAKTSTPMHHAAFLLEHAQVETQLKKETATLLRAIKETDHHKLVAQVGMILAKQFRLRDSCEAFISKVNILEALNRLIT